MFNKKLFKTLLEKAIGNKTITQFAKESGVNRTSISNYLNLNLDNPPNPDILERIANNTEDITYEEFMAAAGYYSEKVNRFLSKYINDKTLNAVNEFYDKYRDTMRESQNNSVPVITIIKKNHPLTDQKNISKHIKFPEEYVNNNSFSIQIKDNSMEKMRIYKGDYLLINPLDGEPEAGKTFYINLDGKKTIKRYYPIGDKVKLEPSNGNNKPIDKKNIDIIGQVVFLQREFY